jgi:ABC-type Fe3+/spermidine/putrescine transport system ATPase subunit
VTKSNFLKVDAIEKNFKETKAVNQVSFSLEQGEFLTLLGPSGCGKTTTLRAIAGFESIDAGRIVIDDTTVSAPADRVHVPAEKRSFGMVFQSYAVWPHMTVGQNVAYGLHNLKLSGSEQRERVARVLEMVGLEAQIDRPATMLSGGQQQRVALARAIVYEPKVLLFDEPLSNLDAKLRERMRLELRRLQADLGITSLYVTHDQEEAMVVSDRVIVMNLGRIEQIGAPEEIYDRPRNRFVAQFVGSANIFPVKVSAVDGATGSARVEAAIGSGHALLTALADEPVEAGGGGFVCIRDENIHLVGKGEAAPTGANIVAGTVLRRINMGSYVEDLVLVNGHEISVRSPRSVIVEENQTVDLAFDPAHCRYLPG